VVGLPSNDFLVSGTCINPVVVEAPVDCHKSDCGCIDDRVIDSAFHDIRATTYRARLAVALDPEKPLTKDICCCCLLLCNASMLVVLHSMSVVSRWLFAEPSLGY
jgi:hypothetical protein